ncbi:MULTISPECIES: response regulator transcription factor [unclassified Rathayibacter]|uniref:response regulator transcription factor n=1 Tax=unclassified Rathayibacter TaxID=2609250 RepID=UPI00188D057D|nr:MULTISPECIES: response regulator transcription factor [unclassified Rathayibacter]MBF4462893.1 response regulator transcription factor [Rathayibacter sp. VKM Ac-2879]MBF4504307.1 response regulator transcription factor [Rathayibacter sp. VKM Ac-2878]
MTSIPATRADSPTPLRVLLVDDDPLVLIALRLLFRTDPSIDVVGAIDDGAHVLSETRRLSPQVVVLDAKMKVVSAPAVLGPLRQAFPELGILVMSSFLGEQAEDALLRAGASAFITKVAPPAKILAEVRRVAGVRASRSTRVSLSARERDVARSMADGLTNTAIAERLGLTASTTRTYVSRLFTKTGLRTRLEVANAVHSGVLDVRDADS